VNIKLVIFDWAGTLVDHGCRAPMEAFLQAFDAEGLPISEAVARGPMGAHKLDHVKEILAQPEVAARLPAHLAGLPAAARADRLYRRFTQILLELLPQHAAPIAGVPQALAALRRRGVHIGSCSGYTRAMMDRLEPLARAAGVAPELVVCADEVPAGRPAPWACFRIAAHFGVDPTAHALKVGDTPSDIAEGRNAGMATLGITATGNEVGLSVAALAALAPGERAARVAVARERLAGADHWLESVADLPAWLDARATRA
jgi:phosphonoacetaldehyde hydrolase